MINGYLSKWLIIISKPFKDSTRYCEASLPERKTLPVLKKFLILFNNIKSFLCKLITNLHATRQPNLYLLSFIIVNIKEPSPSVNPITY